MKYNERNRSPRPHRWQARPRWRLSAKDRIALGPGKRDLLVAIRDTGSITAAAAALRMSYRRAWLLVEEMNRCFARPLVITSRERRAGAKLTTEGERALRLYQDMESASLRAARRPLRALLRLLR